MAAAAAKKYGVPVSLFLAQIKQESGFNPRARSGAGAVGIAQIVPKWHPGVDATNPIASLDYAAKYMATLHGKYGSWAPALSVYNSGNPNAYKDPSFAGGQTYNYVKGILSQGATPKAGSGLPSTIPGGAGTVPAVLPPQPHYNIAPLLALLKQNGGLSTYQHLRSLMPQVAPQGQLGAPVQLPRSQVKVAGKVTSNDMAAVKLASHFIGTNYVYGGSSPKTGFDCSGLIQYVWHTQGVNIPRTTYEQFKTGQSVGRGQLRPGDAVFFKGSDSQGGLPGHVGMYIGNGKYIEAPHTGATVRISLLKNASDYQGARRYG